MFLKALVAFLAKMHVEFILIRSLLEDNGRIPRLLLDVMTVNAGAQSLPCAPCFNRA